MAFPVSTRSAGDLITSAIWNADVVNNLNFFRQRSSFLVNLSGNQSINNSTWTKLSLNTEVFDTNSDYDAGTNYRHTPTVAGKYLYYLVATWADLGTDTVQYNVAAYKNGSKYTETVNFFAGANYQSATTTALISMNGTTDYAEFYIVHFLGSAKSVISTATSTYAFGILVERT